MADKKKDKGAKVPRNVDTVKKLYRMEGGRLVRQKRECPKCGAGVFMAQHEDRVSCGRCGYTEFKKA